MNLDEFLNECGADARYMRADLRGDDNVAARIDKLLALVRKLREQRDEAIKSACASPEASQGSETWDEMAARDIADDNAALDEIVRGG